MLNLAEENIMNTKKRGVMHTLNKMKTAKTSGHDGAPPEMLNHVDLKGAKYVILRGKENEYWKTGK